MSENTSPRTWTGGCHCGHVRIEIVADIQQVMACNCSICSKRGWLLTFVQDPNFKRISGDDQREYLFGHKRVHHLFCATCGVTTYSYGEGRNGQEFYAINARALDGFDPTTANIKHVDGKSLPLPAS